MQLQIPALRIVTPMTVTKVYQFDKITFLHGETEKTVSITLINEKIVKTAADLNKEEFGDGTEEVEDIQDLMFKLVIEKA